MFLAIYSKLNHLNVKDIESPIRNFTLNGTREVMTITFPGMMICIAKKFEKKFAESENAISFISGHIAFDAVNVKSQITNEAFFFNKWIQEQIQPDFEKLEGAFAAIHYNKKEHRLLLVNDKFGAFPMFIHENKELIIASNEYQPIINYHPQITRKADYTAIAEFYTLGVVLGNKTFFKNIHNQSPATCTLVNGPLSQTKTYWMPTTIEPRMEVSNKAGSLYTTFTNINREYAQAGLTNMCLLSAGADSRLILATLTEEQRKQTKFYTSNLSFLNENEDKDVIGARLLSSTFRLNHQVEKISFYEDRFSVNYFSKGRTLRNDHVYGGWHGGEFLGGYFFKAAPLPNDPGFALIDQRLKSVFSLPFRLKLRKHPYHSYQEELAKVPVNGRERLFLIQQMLRSFFTSIYGGSRGHWLQPYQLTHHGFSPFWDSRFLTKLLEIPSGDLNDYAFYNEVLKCADKVFTNIPSNSPLTSRNDSVIPPMNTGIEPKSKVPDMHHQTFVESIAADLLMKNSMYNKRKLREILTNEQDAISKRWLDFEIWFKYVQNE